MTDVLQQEEQKLLEVEPEVTEYEFAITGATGFDGGKDVHVEDIVSISLGAECVGVRIEKKTRKSDNDEGEEEYLVRRVILKATGARIR